MPHENQSEPRRSLGPALASAVVGALLGGALILTAAHAAYQTELPEAAAVSQDKALLGGPEYGER